MGQVGGRVIERDPYARARLRSITLWRNLQVAEQGGPRRRAMPDYSYLGSCCDAGVSSR